jgi:hypothetical protein
VSQRSARRSFCLIAALAVCSGSALAVVGIDLAQVRLTWGAAPNAANYDVYRSLDALEGALPEVDGARLVGVADAGLEVMERRDLVPAMLGNPDAIKTLARNPDDDELLISPPGLYTQPALDNQGFDRSLMLSLCVLALRLDVLRYDATTGARIS